MISQNNKFYGKYRGKVAYTKDPLNLGRIQVEVPRPFDENRLMWAMPCVPYAGKDVGWFTVPPVGSNVWVEFEAGNPDYPIWSGCFWGVGELPEPVRDLAEPEQVQLFKTDGITCIFSKLNGKKALSVEVKTPVVERPLKAVFNADGIEINNNDETVVKIKAQTIEIDNRSTSTLTLATDNIQLKEKTVEIKLTGTAIEETVSPSVLKITASAIEAQTPPSTVKLTIGEIALSNAAAQLKVAPASSELSNGAASVKLTPVSVNLNNGALEVI